MQTAKYVVNVQRCRVDKRKHVNEKEKEGGVFCGRGREDNKCYREIATRIWQA
jgi:hypothetical protein